MPRTARRSLAAVLIAALVATTAIVLGAAAPAAHAAPAPDHGYPGTRVTLEASQLPVFTQLAHGQHNTYALTNDGRVYAWGHGEGLGRGTGEHGRTSPIPRQVFTSGEHPNSNLRPWTPVTQIAASSEGAYAIAGGKVYFWGRGLPGVEGFPGWDRVLYAREIPVPASVVQVVPGEEAVYALDTEGRVWAWGLNDKGQLGNGSVDADFPPPAAVPGLPRIAQIAAASATGYALAVDGNVYAWGSNAYGALGDGSTVPYSATPVKVQGLPLESIHSVPSPIQIAAHEHGGYAHNGREVWAWGAGGSGQLGSGGTPAAVRTATRIIDAAFSHPDEGGVAFVAGGAKSGYAMTRRGLLYAWGEVGLPGLGDTRSPKRVSLLPWVDGIANTASDRRTTGYSRGAMAAFQRATREAWSWGPNDFGQVGTGVASDTPVTGVSLGVNLVPTGARFGQLDGEGFSFHGGRLQVNSPSRAPAGPAPLKVLAELRTDRTARETLQFDAGAFTTIRQFVSVARPTLSGTAAVGSELTATGATASDLDGAVTDANITHSWWIADDESSTGMQVATGPSFTPGREHAGAYVYATTVASKEHYEDASAPPTERRLVQPLEFDRLDRPVVTPSRNAVFGTTLRVAEPPEFSPRPDAPEAGVVYQWLRDGAPIAGATGESYTLSVADVEHEITVQATVSALGYTSRQSRPSASVYVDPASFAHVSAPALSSTRIAVGAPVTASGSQAFIAAGAVDEAAIDYHWYVAESRAAQGVPAGIGEIFTPTPAMLGKWVYAIATASAPGYLPMASAPSPRGSGDPDAPGPVAEGELVSIEQPVLAPTSAGWPRTLIVQNDPPAVAPDVSDASISYLWYRDGEPIAGAAGSSYTSTAEDAGHDVTVVAEVSAPGYAVGRSAHSNPSAVHRLSFASVSTPALSSAVFTVDEPVTASGSVASNDSGPVRDAEIEYQWFVADTRDAPGRLIHTGDTFAPDGAAVGKWIYAVASATRHGYHPASSAPTPRGGGDPSETGYDPDLPGPVEPTVFASIAAPRIGPDAAAWPAKLTVQNDPVGFAPAASEAAIGYQWFRDGSAIAGETGADYTTREADAGRSITVRATVSAPGYAPMTSAPSNAITVALARFASVSAPTLSSDRFVVDAPVTASGSIAFGIAGPLPDATITYRWYAADARSGPGILVHVGETFTPAAGLAGKRLYATATASRSGYHPLTSAEAPRGSGSSEPGHQPGGQGVVAPAVFTAIDAPELESVRAVDSPRTLTVLNHPVGYAPSVSGAALDYRWFRDGERIDGAAGESYTTAPGDAGFEITARAVVTAPGYTSMVSQPSNAVEVRWRDFARVGEPRLSGEMRAGEPITASGSAASDASGPRGDAFIAYRWYAAERRGATGTLLHTGETFTPGPMLTGKLLYVVATASEPGYRDLDSGATWAEAPVWNQPELHLSASTAQPGSTVSVRATGLVPGERVDAAVHSDPVRLGSRTADARGEAGFAFTVPAGFEPGEHTVRVTSSLSSEATATLRILADDAGAGADGSPGGSADGGQGDQPGAGLGETGSRASLALIAIAMPILVTGVALLLIRRRNRDSCVSRHRSR